MKRMFFVCICPLFLSQDAVSQQKGMPGSQPLVNSAQGIQKTEDSLISEKLVSLALSNPALKIADANIAIAKANLRKAKSTYLNSVSLSGNINEFVITGSDAASFFPKYNLGVFIPLDLFARSKAEKNLAIQNISITTAQKKAKEMEVRTAVLILYENYKEQKELVRIQKVLMEPDYQGYLSAQKRYSEGEIQIEELNSAYQTYVNQSSRLVTKERDFRVAVLELEGLIGVSLTQVLESATNRK